MTKLVKAEFVIAHVLAAATALVIVAIPNVAVLEVGAFEPLLAAMALIELCFLVSFARGQKRDPGNAGPCGIAIIVWAILLAWELASSKSFAVGSTLLPPPENVVAVFTRNPGDVLLNVGFSVQLLGGSFVIGFVLAVVLGAVCGWIKPLRNLFVPIATALVPIPVVILTPYLVTINPDFRLASFVVVIWGIFWSKFLSVMNRVNALPADMMANVRIMHVGKIDMIFKVLVPYLAPSFVKNLKIELAMASLALMYAETFGCSNGIGFFVNVALVYNDYAQITAGTIVIIAFVTLFIWLAGLVQKGFKKRFPWA